MIEPTETDIESLQAELATMQMHLAFARAILDKTAEKLERAYDNGWEDALEIIRYIRNTQPLPLESH